jgi:hypothetical protein
MLFGDEPRFYKDLKPTYEGGNIFAHVQVFVGTFSRDSKISNMASVWLPIMRSTEALILHHRPSY